MTKLILQWLSACVLVVFISGCAATNKIDWEARRGVYTFDQAVTDQGPPDKQARLSDGSIVAEWLTRRGYTTVSPAYHHGFCGPFCGHGVVPMVESRSPDVFLRLTFDAENKLSAWKRFVR